MACLLYLDGQLDASRSRELAAHAGECAACHERLRALERESQFLTGALIEDTEPMPARLIESPRWTMPSWGWTLAFGVFAAGVYWMWTDGIGPWLDRLSNAGFGGTDLLSMAVFTGAFWEGWSDMIDVMEIAALIVVAIMAIGLIQRRLRQSTAIGVVINVVLAALLLAVALPQKAAAADVRRARSIYIPAGETVHNDLIATGTNVRIDGTVQGDLIAFTRDLTVTGHVTGDIIAFAAQARIDGVVDGNVRVFSRDVMLEGSVAKNASAIANTVDFSPKADIGGELITIAGTANLDGKIHRDLLGISRATDLDGFLGGQAWIRGGTLSVNPAADIRGPVTFRGRQQPMVTEGAKLVSPIQTEIMQMPRRSRRSAGRVVFRQIFSIAAAVGVGALLAVLFPGFFRTTLRAAGAVGLPMGIGALAIIASVFLLILGVLLLLGLGVGAGIAAVFAYAPVVYLAQVFVGAWLGNKILGEASSVATRAGSNAVFGRIALGVVLLHVAGQVPVLGGLMWLVVVLWGTGAVLLGFYRLSRVEGVLLPA
jgi:cytoskeletal protein CcmA (bactofilin family)/anti-sigma factor RsiW